MKNLISSWGNLFQKESNIKASSSFGGAQTPRGAGLSYNNIAISKEVNMGDRSRIEGVDKDGIISLSSKVTIKELIDHAMPLGFFPAVVPGTKNVTIGGCIASNIHGKNHHIDGSFCDHVEEITVITRKSEKKVIKKGDEDFFDFCGAFGTTGLIVSAKVKLSNIGVAKSFISKKEKTYSLEETMNLLNSSKQNYTVAWLDTSADKESLGRGLFISGDWDQSGKPVENSKLSISIPKLPSFLLSTKLTFNLMNKIYYSIHKDASEESNEGIDSFLFPLDKLANWDNAYGDTGMLQFQAVTTGKYEEAYTMINELLLELKKTGGSSFITVLKKFGDSSSSNFFDKAMNFQVANGYTLAIDVPATKENLKLAEQLEKISLSHNGRVYLSKAPRLFDKTSVMSKSGWGDWLKSMMDKYNFKNKDLSDFFQESNPEKENLVVFGANSDILKEMLVNSKQKDYDNILLTTRSGEVDENLLKSLRAQAKSVKVEKLDLSKSEDVDTFVQKKKLDLFDRVVYAAGLMDSQVSDFNKHEVVEVNQLSPIKIFNQFISTNNYMGKRKSIVYFSSVTTMRGKGSTLFYSLSKKATEMYLEGIMTSTPYIDIYISRTGFVKSKMTDSMDLPSALTITSQEAGRSIAKSIDKNKTGYIQPQKIWVVAELTLKLLPLFLWRKIDEGK